MGRLVMFTYAEIGAWPNVHYIWIYAYMFFMPLTSLFHYSAAASRLV